MIDCQTIKKYHIRITFWCRNTGEEVMLFLDCDEREKAFLNRLTNELAIAIPQQGLDPEYSFLCWEVETTYD